MCTDPNSAESRPNHVVAFIRPKPKMPPNLATFVVPLTFNKFDLRDYLFHAYSVDVTSVRSFINEAAVKKKHGTRGKHYRPRSQKMMIAELVKPFVWPEPPAKDDRDDFDYDIFSKMESARSKHLKKRADPSKIPMLSQAKLLPPDRAMLKEQAEEFMKNGGWTNGRTEDGEEWKEVDEDVKI
jgi:large subunit ribosomal protein L23